MLGIFGGLRVQTWHMFLGSISPQYYIFGCPMYLGYVSFIEELPLRGEAVCQKMDSQF
jgi:hypothetical protein